MITANKGRTMIAGMNLDIIYEFNNIINALQEEHPEIVLGVFTAWSDILSEKLESVSKTELCIVTQMSEDFIKLNESEGDND